MLLLQGVVVELQAVHELHRLIVLHRGLLLLFICLLDVLCACRSFAELLQRLRLLHVCLLVLSKAFAAAAALATAALSAALAGDIAHSQAQVHMQSTQTAHHHNLSSHTWQSGTLSESASVSPPSSLSWLAAVLELLSLKGVPWRFPCFFACPCPALPIGLQHQHVRNVSHCMTAFGFWPGNAW